MVMGCRIQLKSFHPNELMFRSYYFRSHAVISERIIMMGGGVVTRRHVKAERF